MRDGEWRHGVTGGVAGGSEAVSQWLVRRWERDMSDNDSRRAIVQQSPKAKERLRELRRKTEKITNLYLGVRVRVTHKTSLFSFFFFSVGSNFWIGFRLAFRLLYCIDVGTGVSLRSPASTPSVGSNGGAVLSAPVGLCTLLRESTQITGSLYRGAVN